MGLWAMAVMKVLRKHPGKTQKEVIKEIKVVYSAARRAAAKKAGGPMQKMEAMKAMKAMKTPPMKKVFIKVAMKKKK